MNSVSPEIIANLALDTFAKLPPRCKPRSLPDGRKEWTPISAVILSQSNSDPKDNGNGLRNIEIISLATGTKSLPVSALSRCQGLILHDRHAEILALRSFNYWLLREMRRLLEYEDVVSTWLELLPLTDSLHDSSFPQVCKPFRLREGTEISLFSTEAPCGDASMELLMAATKAAGRNVTPWCTTDTEHAHIPPGRGNFSYLGALRRKPARADAEISMSKSCTDKLMLKQFTGLLSFPVDLLVQHTEETFLKRMIVYEDQWSQTGYQRAFGQQGRLRNVVSTVRSDDPQQPRFFETKLLSRSFRKSEYSKHDQTTGQKSRSSNISSVWVVGTGDVGRAGYEDLVEVLLNGVKQGFKQFDERERKGSVLCRRNMTQEGIKIVALLREKQYPVVEALGMATEISTYSGLKASFKQSRRAFLKDVVLEKLGGWPHKAYEDEFDVSMLSSLLH